MFEKLSFSNILSLETTVSSEVPIQKGAKMHPFDRFVSQNRAKLDFAMPLTERLLNVRCGAKNFFGKADRPGISGAVLCLQSGIYPFAGSISTTVRRPSETEKRTSKPANRKPYTLSGSF